MQYFGKFSEKIKYLDNYGAFFQLLFTHENKIYKSLYGGIITIFINCAICSYLFYALSLWLTDQFPPTVVQVNKSIQSLNLSVTQPLFLFSVHIDRFDSHFRQEIENKSLFTVSGRYYGINNSISELTMIPKNYNCGRNNMDVDLYQPLCQNPFDFNQTFLYSGENRMDDSYWEYNLNFCNPKSNTNCVSQKQFEKFEEYGLYWKLTTNVQDVDANTGQVYNISREFYSQIQQSNHPQPYYQIKVTKAEVLIDDGILFQNWRKIEIVKNIEAIISYYPIKEDIGPVILVSLEKYVYSILVSHVKLGTILADVGSIIQGLLVLGFAASFLNSHLLELQAHKIFSEIYFPDLKEFSLEKNWRGKIVKVLRDGKQLNDEQTISFKNQYSQILEIVQQKFSHSQVLRDINFINITLHLLLPDKIIEQLSLIRYKIKLDETEKDILLSSKDFTIFHKQTKHDQNQIDETEKIDLNDLSIFIQMWKNHIEQKLCLPSHCQPKYDFDYDIQNPYVSI